MTSEGFFLLINSLERYFQSTANKCLKKVDEERKEKKILWWETGKVS